MPIRCVNLDWLEVHAREPMNAPRDAAYFLNNGWRVELRPYGTRVYRQMFTLFDKSGNAILEVRRDPASQGLIGIHEANECHIRLKNRTCYFDNAATLLQNFLDKNGYTDVRVSRVDLCLDFVRFDLGDDPAAFVRRYFRHKYAKINQGRICGHGADTWSGQEWNSLSWGALSSPVTTKLYNKTLELFDIKTGLYAKPYIREAWFKCGFIDNIQQVTLKGEKVNIWRVEFSLRSAVKNWIAINLNGDNRKYQSLKNTLDVYNSRGKILVMFASLAQHYFHFKKFRDGVRKDRCEDKVLFRFENLEHVYKIGKENSALGDGMSYKSKFNKLIEKLKLYQMTHSLLEVKKACEVLINSITEENIRRDIASPWSFEELTFLKKLINVKTTHRDFTHEVAVEEVRKLLNISDRVYKSWFEERT